VKSEKLGESEERVGSEYSVVCTKKYQPICAFVFLRETKSGV